MIDKKLLLYLIFGFIAFTVIGTVSHEFGHYFVAKFFGLDAKIHYGYTSWRNSTIEQENALSKIDRLWITLGGPIQTMLTGTFGFLLIIFNRENFLNTIRLNFRQWILVFLTFFWSREIINHLGLIISKIKVGNLSKRGDEVKIANYFELQPLSISWSLFIVALIICSITVFKFIPKQQRLTFILAGFIGGILGYLFWLEYFGPFILP